MQQSGLMTHQISLRANGRTYPLAALHVLAMLIFILMFWPSGLDRPLTGLMGPLATRNVALSSGGRDAWSAGMAYADRVAPDATSDLTSHLLHYWPMNEPGAMDVRVDLVGALDATPSGNGVPATTGHIYRHAAYWDGSEADWLVIPKEDYTGTDIDVTGHVPRTYAVWLYPVGDYSGVIGFYDMIWSREEGCGRGGEQLFLNREGGAIYIVNNGDPTNPQNALCDGLPGLQQNAWNLVFFTHDPDKDQVRSHVYRPVGMMPEDSANWDQGLFSIVDSPVVEGYAEDLRIGGVSLRYNQPRNAHFAMGPLMVFDKVLDFTEKDTLWNNDNGLSYDEMGDAGHITPTVTFTVTSTATATTIATATSTPTATTTATITPTATTTATSTPTATATATSTPTATVTATSTPTATTTVTSTPPGLRLYLPLITTESHVDRYTRLRHATGDE